MLKPFKKATNMFFGQFENLVFEPYSAVVQGLTKNFSTFTVPFVQEFSFVHQNGILP